MKISIIMPLYNAEKYLKETLESVQAQTFREFELICINDASTDSTMDILLEFQKKDEKIIVLSNEARSGAAYSRNKGIKVAKGEYLSFLDGDDIFEEEMLSVGYHSIKSNNVDVLMFEYKHVPSERIYHKEKIIHGANYVNSFCKTPFCIRKRESYEILNWHVAPWNKLYRKDFILSNQLMFQSLSCANDVYFVCMALFLAENVLVLEDERVMVYARDHFEPSRISFKRDPVCTYLAMEKVQQELIKRGIWGEVFRHYYCELLFTLVSALESTSDLAIACEFYTFLQQEGIRRLRALGGAYYEQIDEYIKSGMEQFENQSFDTYWYKNINVLGLYFERNKQQVIDLFQQYTCRGMNIAIWGMGINGKFLLDFCNKHHLKITAVVDTSSEKQGENILGYCVEAPERVYKNVQVIIISGRLISQSVLEMLGEKRKDFEIVDINEFFSIT